MVEPGLRRWADCHRFEADSALGVTGDGRQELVQLHRENGVLRMGVTRNRGPRPSSRQRTSFPRGDGRIHA